MQSSSPVAIAVRLQSAEMAAKCFEKNGRPKKESSRWITSELNA